MTGREKAPKEVHPSPVRKWHFECWIHGGGRRAVVRRKFLIKRSIGSIGFKHEGINHQSVFVVFVGIMDVLAILAMQLGFPCCWYLWGLH